MTRATVRLISAESGSISRARSANGSAAAGSTAGSPAIVGIAGDWTQARYGVVENDVQISISDQATLTIGSETVNLWERNMFAVRAEIEVGFIADTYCFNLLSGATPEA